MRKFIILLIVLPSLIFAQVFDDFSDGNFIVNPEWFGDTSEFKITNSSAIPPEMKPALQLNGSNSDTSTLYLPNTLIQNTEWRFWIKLSFNTSVNNNARIYLVSDQPDLKGELNGYFVQVGESNDSIALYKQTGSELKKIIPGTIAYTGTSTNVLRIKATRDNEGNWELFSDVEGGYNFVFEGTCADNTYSTTGYFGIFCKYTASNASKFYFDDFYVNEIVIDTIPPEINTIEIISANQTDVYFNEFVEQASSENILNYFVNNGIGNPVNAERDQNNFSLVHLEFQQNFSPGVNNTLTISDVEDLSGNVMDSDTINFIYVPPFVVNPFDIVVNEIMADVNPAPDSLPEADYLELYNRTEYPFNLTNWTLKPKESADPIAFPAAIIEPDSFLLIVKTSDTVDFEQYGTVIGLPGFSLNNEGTIILRNTQGILIHAVFYTEEWYKDEEKQDGGWSIEQIDPTHPCIGNDNWKASADEAGGTPGRRNSVDNIIYSSPEITLIEVIDEFSIKLLFNHFMDSLSLVNPGAYSIDNGIGNPVSLNMDDIDFSFVILNLSVELQTGINYNLAITDTLFNCVGDFIPLNTGIPFVLPLDANPYDVVINEIMADPNPPVGLPEYEYIEIFNTTSATIALKDWKLIIGTSEKSIPYTILKPNGYLILCDDEVALLFSMFAPSIGFSSLGLTDSGKTILLQNAEGTVISQVTYKDEWYGDEVKAEGGWSLEQIDPNNPCLEEGNWIAADADAGGTPGSINSVNAENLSEPEIKKVIAIDDQTFEVTFNQIMDRESILSETNYYVDKSVGNPESVILSDSNINKVILTFSNPLQKRRVYTLYVENPVYNCVGLEIITNSSFRFGIHEPADKNEIVINEVLFNPADNGVDFVEIYNNSEKIIDLADLLLGEINVNQFEPNDTVYKSVADESGLMFTGDYTVLTKDPGKVKEQYITPNPEGFIKMNSFPDYNNDEGTVILSGKDGKIIDAFTYDEDMHYPLLNSIDGVSLERINFNRPTEDRTNWHSASKEVGFATPAYKNSQFSDFGEIEDPVTVEPEIFSPDNDGYNDVLNIHYKFEAPGYTANITIYDSQGRLIKYLVQNNLLATQGIFSWDGRTEDNQKANIGIYIIYFEAFDMNGNVKKYKKSAVLGGKL
ncbi:MAG: lamin tail domain-containing protein [Bacteroidales bacterium]|nr:lamin tail domain-containing protein [Bacteroidales bacterium]